MTYPMKSSSGSTTRVSYAILGWQTRLNDAIDEYYGLCGFLVPGQTIVLEALRAFGNGPDARASLSAEGQWALEMALYQEETSVAARWREDAYMYSAMLEDVINEEVVFLRKLLSSRDRIYRLELQHWTGREPIIKVLELCEEEQSSRLQCLLPSRKPLTLGLIPKPR